MMQQCASKAFKIVPASLRLLLTMKLRKGDGFRSLWWGLCTMPRHLRFARAISTLSDGCQIWCLLCDSLAARNVSMCHTSKAVFGRDSKALRSSLNLLCQEWVEASYFFQEIGCHLILGSILKAILCPSKIPRDQTNLIICYSCASSVKFVKNEPWILLFCVGLFFISYTFRCVVVCASN